MVNLLEGIGWFQRWMRRLRLLLSESRRKKRRDGGGREGKATLSGFAEPVAK